jgi:hypothetical protein
MLFKALGKIEAEHANIWKKILKIDKVLQGNEQCHAKNKENLEESALNSGEEIGAANIEPILEAEDH